MTTSMLAITESLHKIRRRLRLRRELRHWAARGFVAPAPQFVKWAALEHFGLGRYGDPLDPSGWRKGFANLASMIAPGGWLYLSVPIGPQRTEFNAHRVFSIKTVLELLAERFTVRRFAYVGDDDDLRIDVRLSPDVVDSNAGCTFGCGIFEAQAFTG